jgi:hypothetical protein
MGEIICKVGEKNIWFGMRGMGWIWEPRGVDEKAGNEGTRERGVGSRKAGE